MSDVKSGQDLAREYCRDLQNFLQDDEVVCMESVRLAFIDGRASLEAENAKLREALKYNRNEMKYRLYQIEQGLKHDDWSHIVIYGEMIKAIEIADHALAATSPAEMSKTDLEAAEAEANKIVWVPPNTSVNDLREWAKDYFLAGIDHARPSLSDLRKLEPPHPEQVDSECKSGR